MVLIENTKGEGTLSLLRGAPDYDPQEELDLEHTTLVDMVAKHWKAKGVPRGVSPPDRNDYPIVIPALTEEGEALNTEMLKRLKTLRQQQQQGAASQSAFRGARGQKQKNGFSRGRKIEIKM